MTIKEYFQTIESITAKKCEIDAMMKQLSEGRRSIDLDEAKRLQKKCYKTFPDDDMLARLSFVFVFVLMYNMPSDAKIPHSVRYILSIILKVQGASISRDWRTVKKMMTYDCDFARKTESIYTDFTNKFTET